MREDICTIPVSEIFEKLDDCPICAMKHRAEEKIITYITGSAMMEPDVRIKTNQQGFCRNHYDCMAKQDNRLSLALMLKSRLGEVLVAVQNKKTVKPILSEYPAANAQCTCFVCEKMQWGIERMIETVYKTFEREEDFRVLFSKQHHFCIPHYQLLMNGASKKNLKKHYDEFTKTVSTITFNHLKTIVDDINGFCDMFDYRNAGKIEELNINKNAIDDAIKFDSI